MQDMPGMPRIYLCSFCGKNQDEVQRLIAGPGMVYVCNECVDRFGTDEASQARQQPQNAERCSFCGKQQRQVQRLFQSFDGVTICNECIALCQLIIAEEPQVRRKP